MIIDTHSDVIVSTSINYHGHSDSVNECDTDSYTHIHSDTHSHTDK